MPRSSAAQGKALVKHFGGEYAEHDRRHHAQDREVERARDRLQKAGVGRQRPVVGQPDERPLHAHLPVVQAHPDREQPGEDDDREDHDQRREQKADIDALAGIAADVPAEAQLGPAHATCQPNEMGSIVTSRSGSGGKPDGCSPAVLALSEYVSTDCGRERTFEQVSSPARSSRRSA